MVFPVRRVLPMRLENKVAIVVGAGQTAGDTIGDGRATAILFAREGARVALVVPGLFAQAQDLIVALSDADVLVQYVDAAISSFRGLHKRPAIFLARHVGLNREALSALRLDQRFGLNRRSAVAVRRFARRAFWLTRLRRPA